MHVSGWCYDLFVDLTNNLYCAIAWNHQVVRTSLNSITNISIIVAGNGTAGREPHMLNTPGGIFVDNRINLYVADSNNDRIQFFVSGSAYGSTIVGNGSNKTIVLNYPTGIVLDADGYLFILESHGDRVVGSSSNGFRCIVGCTNGSGSGSHQLNNPTILRFDSYGNIFVVDFGNFRIQKFFFESNSCST